ncbi:MAG: hypothetical protein ACXAAI_13620 [Promethearchaeota archaeon]|jgi:hypothetical protein
MLERTHVKVNAPIREDIIHNIIELINSKGYTIEIKDAQQFLENFQAKYNRLPRNEEIEAICKGYIIMVNEDYLMEKTSVLHGTEPFSEKNNLQSGEIEDYSESDSESITKDIIESPIGRRMCPSCGGKGSIREVTDKTVLILDYPRIYGKKKYCCRCAYEWK